MISMDIEIKAFNLLKSIFYMDMYLERTIMLILIKYWGNHAT